MLKNKNLPKNKSVNELVGISIIDLKEYLENKFEPWMTWENHGKYNGAYNFGWDIDHITPCSSFNLVLEEEQKKCFNYINLQPLCSRVNIYDKRDNIPNKETFEALEDALLDGMESGISKETIDSIWDKEIIALDGRK